MKRSDTERVLFCLAEGVVLLFSNIAIAQTQQTVRVALDLSEASRIVGTPIHAFLPLQSSFGKISLPLNLIAEVNWQTGTSNVSVALRNGDRIKGSCELRQIELTTVFGKVSARADLASSMKVWLSKGETPGLIFDNLVVRYSFDEDTGAVLQDADQKLKGGQIVGA